MNWNKFTQKLFWWKTNNTDPVIGMYDNDNRKINLALLNTHNNLKEFYKEITILKDFYMSQMMISRIIDDSLNTSPGEELFSVTILNDDESVNELATKEANQLKRNLNLERLISDIAPDILAYGNYYLRLDINDDKNSVLKGIINIHDDVDISEIIPVFRDGNILYYNVIKNGKIEKVPPYKYVFFGYSTERIKVQINLNDEEVLYFRVGNGILKPVLTLLKTLYLLEGLIYVNLIKKASKQSILSVSVPENMTPDKAIDVARAYEKLVNENINKVDINFDNIKGTLEDILENTSKVKVIPDWGNKGQVQKQDFEIYSDLEEIYEKINDLRELILKTNGFPTSLFEDNGSRLDIIQNNVRYTKKIKTFHNTLKNGLQHLFLIHLRNLSYDITIKNIKIDFINVIDINDIEKLEYLNMVIETMSNIKDLIDDIADKSDELNIEVNNTALINFYNTQFKKFFIKQDIFALKENDEVQK